MASRLLRFVFLLACVVDVAKATEEQKIEEKTNVQPAATPQAEATNHEDVEAILRELQTQGEPAPDMAATTKIKGSYTAQLSNAKTILANATLKKAFENGVGGQIASNIDGVNSEDVAVTASEPIAGGRRLESAEPRQLTAGAIKVDYTITVPSTQSATVLAKVKTAMTVEKITKLTLDAIKGIDSSLCSDCDTATVSGTVINTAPAVEGATSSSSSTGTDTSSADRSHVLWAIFSFAATWIL